MATISLKAYISRVDTLLTVGNLDEVVHHCRHILVSYPRNAEASHMLGQALVQNGRQRLRGAGCLAPCLSHYAGRCRDPPPRSVRSSEHNGLFQEAIWHLERASEHATENRSYRERLRSLYRLHRGAGAELPEGLPGAVAPPPTAREPASPGPSAPYKMPCRTRLAARICGLLLARTPVGCGKARRCRGYGARCTSGLALVPARQSHRRQSVAGPS